MMEPVLFCCQSCKARLAVTGIEQMSSDRTTGSGVEHDGHRQTKPEDSFILLEPRLKDRRRGKAAKRCFSSTQERSATEQSGNRAVDESFVVLGPISSPASQRDGLERDEGDTNCFHNELR